MGDTNDRIAIGHTKEYDSISPFTTTRAGIHNLNEAVLNVHQCWEGLLCVRGYACPLAIFLCQRVTRRMRSTQLTVIVEYIATLKWHGCFRCLRRRVGCLRGICC